MVFAVDLPDSSRPLRRVLIVDDNAPERSALARLLALKGFEVHASADGSEAIAALESEPSFDIVLTDLRLPDLDGREVALRAAHLTPRPVIALMTGWDYDLDAEDRTRWGINLLFMKPLDMRSLLDRLEVALNDVARA